MFYNTPEREDKMLLEGFGKLGKSIISNDIYILWAAIIELILFTCSYSLAKNASARIEKQKNKKKRCTNKALISLYNVFCTGISIFPLLGMFGTVMALLGLDLAANDMTNIRNNFFMALTSTAWGIIFSIVFKILHAVYEDFFTKQIDESTKLVKECNRLFEKANW